MELIERAVAQAGSAKAVAKLLGISEAYVSQLRSGVRPMKEKQVWKLARFVGADPIAYLLPLFAGQERDEDEKAYWLGELKGLRMAGGSTLAAFVALVILAGLDISGSKAYAGNRYDGNALISNTIFNAYIISR